MFTQNIDSKSAIAICRNSFLSLRLLLKRINKIKIKWNLKNSPTIKYICHFAIFLFLLTKLLLIQKKIKKSFLHKKIIPEVRSYWDSLFLPRHPSCEGPLPWLTVCLVEVIYEREREGGIAERDTREMWYLFSLV